MIELCCEYLYVRCIWLYVLIMSRMCFRVNPHFIVAWMSRNFLLEAGTIECEFTLKRVCDMIRTYSQMHCADKHWQHRSIIWLVWLNGLVFFYELSGCGFGSTCSQLNLIFSVFHRRYPFFGNLFEKTKIVNWDWNLEPRLNRICRIRWWYSFFSFLDPKCLFWVNLVKKIKFLV